MDTSKVILSRCQFSNIGLHHLLSETFRKEKVISFDNQQNLFSWTKEVRRGSFFTLYLVLPDSIYSNIIYFHWLISLRKKAHNATISEVIIAYHSDIFPTLFSCICSHFRHRLVNINNLTNDEIIKKNACPASPQQKQGS